MRVALAAALLALALPAVARAAGTADVDASGVLYQGDGGANVVTFTDSPSGAGSTVVIAEPGISETNPAGSDACVPAPGVISCALGNDERVLALFAGGADVGTVAGTRLDYFLRGEGGDDRLTGSDGTLDPGGGALVDDLEGGAGRDLLRGRGGNDDLAGGEDDGDDVDAGDGDDELEVIAGDGANDTLNGGPGIDLLDVSGGPPGFRVDLRGGSVSRSDGAERHVVAAVEDVDGSLHDDQITGTDASNELEGDDGNDQLEGLLGGDLLEGQAGNDAIQARDGVNDRAFGGLGTDTCLLDQLDDHTGCESALVATLPPFGTPPPADQAGPRCRTTGLRSRARRRSVLRSGLRFRVLCDEGARLAIELRGSVRRLRRGSRLAAAGQLILGTTGARLGAGNRRTVRVRVSRRLRGLFGRRATVRVYVRATDALGNSRTITRRVRVG